MREILASPWRAVLWLLAAIALAYASALSGPYQFDDFDAFVDVPAAHSWSAWWRDLGHGLRPLLKLSYLIDWQLGGGAFGFHLTNLLIHAANTLLVWWLARRCFTHWRLSDDALASRRAALLVALLFALHPAQTEAVTYISGRSVSLMTLAMLLSTFAYLHRRWWLALTAFIAALAIKEPAAILPLLLLLIEACGPAPASSVAARRGRLALFFVVPLLLGGWMLLHSRYADFLLSSLGTRSIASNLLSQLGALRYLAELALGWRAPNIDPDLGEIAQWSASLALTALLFAALLYFSIRQRQRRPWLMFAVFWALIALLPTNSLLPRYDIVNDRQFYLASVGPCIGIGAELLQRGGFVLPRWRYASAVFALLCISLLVATVQRNADYRSEIALWRATTDASPGKARPWNNLGYAYQLAGCDVQAAEAYRRALQLEPDYQRASDNLLVLEVRAARTETCP